MSYRIVAYKDIQDTTGKVLFEPQNFGNKIISGKITLALNTVGTAEIVIPMNNSLYNDTITLKPIKSLVKIYNVSTGDVIFDGRVAKVSNMFSNYHSKTVSCEDCLAYLHDSTQCYRKVQHTSIYDFLKQIIDYHNQQVEPYKRFKLGRVTVTNSTDNVYRYTDAATDTFDTIKDKLIDRMGGYLVWRRDDVGALVLDYLQDYGSVAEDQPIRLGSNLKSASREVDVSEVITRLVPVGSVIEQQRSTDEDTSADAAQPKVGIESVNSGKRYLDDPSLEAEFGIIEKAVEWQDVKIPLILKQKGQQYLAAQRAGLESWNLEAIDISQIDPTYKPFKLGDIYPVMDNYLIPNSDDLYSLLNSKKAGLQLTGLSVDVVASQSVTLTIGNQNKTLSQYQLENQAAAEYAQSQAEEIQSLTQQVKDLQKQEGSFNETQNQIKDLENRLSHIDGGGNAVNGYYSGSVIDVSQWQGAIDWNTVNGAGLALAIVRVQDGSDVKDGQYQRNLEAICDLGMNYAVYAYFRGQSIADSRNEARVFYQNTQAAIKNGHQPRFYAIDVEDTYEMQGVQNYRAGIEAYMNELNSLGVLDNRIVLYIANQYFDSFNLNTDRAGSIWIPTYGPNTGSIPDSSFKPKHSPLDLWQYTSKGRINGISGDVDMSTPVSDRFKKRFLSK